MVNTPAPVLMALALCIGFVFACDMGEPLESQDILPGDEFDVADVGNPRALLLEWEAQGAIPSADVNGDGVVNIADLVIVAQNFGMTVDDAQLPPVSVLDADGRLVSREEDFLGMWAASWEVTLRNNELERHSLALWVSLLDAEGFALAETVLPTVHIGGHETLELSALAGVAAEAGDEIAGASARVTMWH